MSTGSTDPPCSSPLRRRSSSTLDCGGLELLRVGAGAGQLQGRRLDALDGPEAQLRALAVDGGFLDVDHNRLADAEFLPQDPLRERVLHQLLDGPAQWPRPELRVVALF